MVPRTSLPSLFLSPLSFVDSMTGMIPWWLMYYHERWGAPGYLADLDQLVTKPAQTPETALFEVPFAVGIVRLCLCVACDGCRWGRSSRVWLSIVQFMNLRLGWCVRRAACYAVVGCGLLLLCDSR